MRRDEETSFSDRESSGLKFIFCFDLSKQYLSGMVQGRLHSLYELLWLPFGHGQLSYRNASAFRHHKGGPFFTHRLFGDHRSGSRTDDLRMALSFWLCSGDVVQDKDSEVVPEQGIQLY